MFLSDLKDMLEGMKSKIYYKTFKKITNWDENYLKFLQSTVDICIGRIHNLLTKSFTVKIAFDEYVNIRDDLVETLNEVDGSGPDIFLNVTSDGKLLAFHRFKMNNYFHSQAFDANGQNCGKLHSILVKPSSCIHSCSNCGCFFGKFETLLWIGSEKEISEWLPQNTIEMASNKINFTIERFYKCNVYVHQAKIQPGADKSGLSDPKLVITVNGMHERTKVRSNNSKMFQRLTLTLLQVVTQSLSAVWNEVLVIENVKIFDIGEGKQSDYPSITMLLFDEDKRKVNS